MLLIQINEQERLIPSTAHDITIGQRIDFAFMYGNELDKRLVDIRTMPDGDDKDIEFTAWQIDKIMQEFAFFSDVPLGVLLGSSFVEQVVGIYFNSLAGLIENE